MTKEEVLRGALALNGGDNPYTVTVDGDRIITEAKYTSRLGESAFRSVAHLYDDHTYVEVHEDRDPREMKRGKVTAVQTTVKLSFDRERGGLRADREHFNSEDCKRVVRDYLARCGYTRTNRGFWRRLFGK